MSGINPGDDVSDSSVGPSASRLGTQNLRQKFVFESSEGVSVIPTFDDLNLKEDLLRGIYAYSVFSSLFTPAEPIMNTFYSLLQT